ncbi:hypothetical protein SeLEV6574_g03411 [Synchytrium endobioticum]|nr:hypothetical protein SeLEV6574_g03411 [Synchytrium endobioticum]
MQAQVTKSRPDYEQVYRDRYREWNRNNTRLLRTPLARLASPKLHSDGFVCGIHTSLLTSPDFDGQFALAYRFVLSQTWLELECTHSESRANHPPGIPRTINICLTLHPLIVHVVPADYCRTWLCFTQTMEVLDVHEEGVIEMGYRRLLECDSVGLPRDSIKGWRENQVLQRLLDKQQTILLSHPRGISPQIVQRARDDDTEFQLARRYVFQNSKFFVSATDDETLPIHPWLGPLESVNSVVPPPCFGSDEITMIQCALGFSRILVLCETGQIVHSFVESPQSPAGTRSAIWKRLLGIGSAKSFKQRGSSPVIEYLASGTIILGLSSSINGVGLPSSPDPEQDTQPGSDVADSGSDLGESDVLIRVI